MKKEVLIFGANSPLGRSVTEVLSAKKYGRIYLFARSSADFNAVNNNTEVIEVKDLGDEQNVRDAFAKIKPSAGTIFYLFNAVGGYTGGKQISDTGVEELDKMINSNIRTNFLLAKYFSKLVKESAGGSICFTSAYVGLYPEAGKGAYGLSKAALIHLVKTLALEGAGFNLTANAIAPFIIDTPENRSWMKKDDMDKALKPAEIGETINEIFNNFHFVNSNIFQLKGRLNIPAADDK
jgi:NAD(P)-dependent dehydrogenase (short-subunit alcohol dehydrogenase family)